MAHKLARIAYRLLQQGSRDMGAGPDYDEGQYQARVAKSLKLWGKESEDGYLRKGE